MVSIFDDESVTLLFNTFDAGLLLLEPQSQEGLEHGVTQLVIWFQNLKHQEWAQYVEVPDDF
jgi:hypothetical protein